MVVCNMVTTSCTAVNNVVTTFCSAPLRGQTSVPKQLSHPFSSGIPLWLGSLSPFLMRHDLLQRSNFFEKVYFIVSVTLLRTYQHGNHTSSEEYRQS